MKKLVINNELVKDVKNIGQGVYAPLTGFLRQEDFLSVVKTMRLKNNGLWPIPIVLDVGEKGFQELRNEKQVLLLAKDKKQIAVLRGLEFYRYDKEFLAENVFGTKDKKHPGVEDVYKMGEYLVAGDIDLLDNSKDAAFEKYNLTPKETKALFDKKGWQTVAAFQTRNVPHQGHEFLQKQALKQADGLFIQPVMGRKKLSDFKDEFILGAYEALIEKHYPKDRVVLGILPLKMRYAGPREALFHALLRKNFGCTHFIVGRDHAGVGDYYGPYDAQKIFDKFSQQEIGINILKYDNVVFCKKCGTCVFENDCVHGPEYKVSFSGTKLREKLQKRDPPPSYIIRPVVYDFLSSALNPLIDRVYQKQKNHKGFVLWFTGLPCSGKTTIANNVAEMLQNKGVKTERLDGDIVRQFLSKDLGFSKEDRDKNLERVGFVAQLLSKNGVAVLASFVSPYRTQREMLRSRLNNFIEVFVSAPVEICEKRDVKDMYQRARQGEIANFTGISAPYEEPESPEIKLKTHSESIDQCAQKVINYLTKNNLI